jgi:simple sugar transport system ATP-binding protein
VLRSSIILLMVATLQNNQLTSLRLAAVSKSYGPTRALDEVNLSVNRGEVVALMGANGAGKSTLAKIASGVLRPDSGGIFIADREVRLNSPRAAREEGVVIVHQSTDQLGVPGLSVAENLLLDVLCDGRIGALAGKRKLWREAEKVAAGIGLDLGLERDFGELGPAQRQLIAIARAVAAKASVVIFDEPTASLAPIEAEQLFDTIDRLRARGVGVLYISHRLADIRRVADRIVVLRNGRVVREEFSTIDLTGAVTAMIGRDISKVGTSRLRRKGGEPILRLHQVRLICSAERFDLSVHAGEIVAVTGALGSGKSLLLGALFGLSTVVDGEVFFKGRSWQPKGPAAAIARGVFMAGEDRWRSSFMPPAVPGSDIAGTIALPHRRRWFPFGLVRANREQVAATEVIEALGIRCSSSLDTLDLLSGGNQQKVVVGRWQAAPCELLLLDEPFQGVDVGARSDLIAAIRAQGENRATIVATTDVEEALEVADIVAVMRNQSITGLFDLRIGHASSFLAAICAVEASEAYDQKSVSV